MKRRGGEKPRGRREAGGGKPGNTEASREASEVNQVIVEAQAETATRMVAAATEDVVGRKELQGGVQHEDREVDVVRIAAREDSEREGKGMRG